MLFAKTREASQAVFQWSVVKDNRTFSIYTRRYGGGLFEYLVSVNEAWYSVTCNDNYEFVANHLSGMKSEIVSKENASCSMRGYTDFLHDLVSAVIACEDLCKRADHLVS